MLAEEGSAAGAGSSGAAVAGRAAAGAPGIAAAVRPFSNVLDASAVDLAPAPAAAATRSALPPSGFPQAAAARGGRGRGAAAAAQAQAAPALEPAMPGTPADTVKSRRRVSNMDGGTKP